MIVAPQPINEKQRLAALLRYEVLDSAPERAYDDIVTLAAQICGTPVALMGLVDTDRVWHKARIGVPVEEAPRATSFCQHTILQDVPLVVPDTARDERFRDSPIVVDGPRIRFYAGAPLLTGDGHAVGTLCAMDTVPRALSAEQMEGLAALSRQVVAQLELRGLLSASRREALTDPLTELGNRRRLMVDFEQLVLEATSDAPVHMLFFDLDGFKAYNDTFGHGAGDALLSRLAGKLAAALTEHGTAYRIGGDEFCALLRGDSEQLDRLRRAASVALSEHGEGFSITASHGAVTLPDDATTATRALQLADARMYGEKAGRSQQASRQTHDALLRVLNERDPELQTHGDSVSRLAVAVGTRLGLNAHALDLLGRAAALHDIGKVAVPDAILSKPGALTSEEWEFMRTHTLLGERILAAAPSLREEAALVRSSHERWDGAGYPDQRASNDIPLGSRIIFACDAYDAMTSPRVYRTARTPAQALRELERCAGSQFDPVVVAALQAELAAAPRATASCARAAARSKAS